MPSVARLRRDARGANLVEYIIVVGLIAIVAIGGFRLFGSSVNDKADRQAACVHSLACDGNGDSSALGPNRTQTIDQAIEKGGGDDGGGGIFGWIGGQAKNFFEGAILGSFGGNTGSAGVGGQQIVGDTPNADTN